MLSMLINSEVLPFLTDEGYCRTLGAHPTILPLNKVSPILPSIQVSLSFTAFGHTLHVQHYLPGTHHSPHHFVRHAPTRLSLISALIPLVGKPHGPFSYLHWYDIVHFRPKPSWFCFWAFPPKCLIPIGYCPCL